MPANDGTLRFEYQRAPDHDAPASKPYPVAVIGAGPVGLATAVDLAQQGVRTVLIDNDDTVSTGSRAIRRPRESRKRNQVRACTAARTIRDSRACGVALKRIGYRYCVSASALRPNACRSFGMQTFCWVDQPVLMTRTTCCARST